MQFIFVSDYRQATFFKRFGQFFSFKNCFTPHFLPRKPERAVAFHSGQLRFTIEL
jgi:hypothetical protein